MEAKQNPAAELAGAEATCSPPNAGLIMQKAQHCTGVQEQDRTPRFEAAAAQVVQKPGLRFAGVDIGQEDAAFPSKVLDGVFTFPVVLG